MTGGQIPLEVDFDKEGLALGFDIIHINPFHVDDNAELFKDLYDRYLKKEKVMVIADGVLRHGKGCQEFRRKNGPYDKVGGVPGSKICQRT